MGGKEISVRSDVFFTFYSLLSTSLFSGENNEENYFYIVVNDGYFNCLS
ncbi:MAG: hypothetical protein AB1422_09080 [bacterium]